MLEYEDAIRDRFEVVSQSGTEFLCLCPFHGDSRDHGRPNLYASGSNGFYYCHACQAKGKIEDDDPSSSSLLTSLRRLEREGPRSRRLVKEPPTLDERYLKQFGYQHDWWETERGFSPETIKLFGLGYDVINDQMIIPFRNHRGQLKGVIRRSMEPGIKDRYRFPTDVKMRRYLFGSWLLDGQRKVAVVEGQLDAIACWNARVPAVAIFGMRIADEQINILHRLGVQHLVLMLDNEKRAQEYAQETINRVDFTTSLGVYRQYWSVKDPGEMKPAQIRKMYHSAKIAIPDHDDYDRQR